MKIDFDNIKGKFEKKANDIYNDNEKLRKLLISVKEMVKGNKQLAEIFDDIKAMMNLLRDWIKGDYKELSKSSAIMIIISFLYLINPIDLIPDFIIGGFIDDVAVIGFVFKKISEEINRYKQWKSINNTNDTVYSSDDFIEINLDQDDEVIEVDYDEYEI